MFLHFAIRVCRVAVKWNVGKPLLRLNDFLHLNFNNNMEKKVKILILDYEIVLGLCICNKAWFYTFRKSSIQFI